MEQVWACTVQAFATGDMDRARSLERFLCALEDLESGTAQWVDGKGSLR
ncbi:MAG: hypothetical protein H0V29_06760 [Thermoleophilaceae bacterium]|nr:hypothetical protein [Thermoleophilaceae bacterium]